MQGNTIHAGGDVGVGGQRSLEHTDIDILFTRNQFLRWVIIDKLPMVPDDLLGAFASPLADAASPSRYQKKLDGFVRFFRRLQCAIVLRFLPYPTNSFISFPRDPTHP